MAGGATLVPSVAMLPVSTLDPAAFKGERAQPSGVPSALFPLAPLSFGTEPQSWPLKQIDRDFVNAAFQLAPPVVPSSQVAGTVLDVNESRPQAGPGRTSSRTLQSAVRTCDML